MQLTVIDLRDEEGFDLLGHKPAPWDGHEGAKRTATVRRIVADIADDGDKAVFGYMEKYDGVETDRLRVPSDHVKRRAIAAAPELVSALHTAADRIIDYHSANKIDDYFFEQDGLRAGRVYRPIRRVGIYVPGGRGAYPSTVLMTACLAKIAGVDEIALFTPPDIEGDVSPAVCAAAQVVGTDEVYTIGGAMAVAAMAYGTKSVPKVDKIFGPGNAWVTIAKREVFGVVGIDGLYGPSESMVLADDSAMPQYVASELLTQAEHDPEAISILVVTSESKLSECLSETYERLNRLPRAKQISEALATSGRAIVVNDVEHGIGVVNHLAPEHLCLHVANPRDALQRVRFAGTVLVGSDTPSTISDYCAGPSHVLPTSGAAKWSSGLSVRDFMVGVNYVECERDALLRLSPTALALCDAEDLRAHRENINVRFES